MNRLVFGIDVFFFVFFLVMILYNRGAWYDVLVAIGYALLLTRDINRLRGARDKVVS